MANETVTHVTIDLLNTPIYKGPGVTFIVRMRGPDFQDCVAAATALGMSQADFYRLCCISTARQVLAELSGKKKKA